MTIVLSSQDKSNIAYRQFVETCRSPSTRSMYSNALRYFMSYLKIPADRYDKLLDLDTKIIQMNICDYITHLKNSGVIASRSIAVYLSAIRKFYSMNDIQLNWDKIHSYQPEEEKRTEDRPYVHSEIQAMIANTTLRNKAIIKLMCSSGPRVGAIPALRIKDLEPIDKYDIYKITYYPYSNKWRYNTYCTPEERKEIDNYLDYRRRWGERLTEDTPLFRKEFNVSDHDHHSKSPVEPVTTDVIRWHIANIKTGVRLQQQHRDRIAESQRKRWEVIKGKQCSACSVISKWIYKVHIPAVSDHELLLYDTDLIEQFHSLSTEDKKQVVIQS